LKAVGYPAGDDAVQQLEWRVLVAVAEWESEPGAGVLGMRALQERLGLSHQDRPLLRGTVGRLISAGLVQPARIGRYVLPRVLVGLTAEGRRLLRQNSMPFDS